MATYLETHGLAENPDFRKRIRVAAYLAGRDILNDGGDNTDARHNLARACQRIPEFILDRFAWECALNPIIASAEANEPNSSPDSDLAYVVASSWDTVAGAEW